MALLWFDGFENYQNVDDIFAVSSEYISAISSEYSGQGFDSTYGRRSSRGIRTYYTDRVFLSLANNYVTIVYGFALYLASGSLPTYDVNRPTIVFYDNVTSQLKFHCDGSEMQVRLGDSSLIDTTSGAGITGNKWVFIEIKATIDNSAGVVVIKVNEQEVLNITSQDTQYSANAYMNKVSFGGINAGLVYTYYDDMYLLDTTGSKNNDFLGDVRVDVLRPDGAGSHTDFTPSAGANYENVDDDPYPDDNSTYNDGDAVAEQDSYAMQGLPDVAPVVAGTTIHGVKSQITARKTDAGNREVKIITRSGGNDYLSDTIPLSDSFTTPSKIYEDNPDDAAAWEDADVNGMEVGIEVTA